MYLIRGGSNDSVRGSPPKIKVKKQFVLKVKVRKGFMKKEKKKRRKEKKEKKRRRKKKNERKIEKQTLYTDTYLTEKG